MNKNLIHIGFSKCGSSFLKHWYKGHPQMHYKNRKTFCGINGTPELLQLTKTLDVDTIKYFVTCDTQLHTFRPVTTEGSDNWFGDKNVAAHQEKICKILSSIFTDSKILIITRGFEGMLKSFYSSYIKRGGVLTFQQMLEKYNKDFILPSYDYDYILSLYAKHFGMENILIYPFELFQNNVASFLSLLEEDLGLDHHSFSKPPVNSSFAYNQLMHKRDLSIKAKKFSKLLGNSLSDKMFSSFSNNLAKGKFDLLLPKPTKSINQPKTFEVAPKILQSYKGKATFAKELPHYQPFLSKYIL